MRAIPFLFPNASQQKWEEPVISDKDILILREKLKDTHSVEDFLS